MYSALLRAIGTKASLGLCEFVRLSGKEGSQQQRTQALAANSVDQCNQHTDNQHKIHNGGDKHMQAVGAPKVFLSIGARAHTDMTGQQDDHHAQETDWLFSRIGVAEVAALNKGIRSLGMWRRWGFRERLTTRCRRRRCGRKRSWHSIVNSR